jgi:hypothetical protein
VRGESLQQFVHAKLVAVGSCMTRQRSSSIHRAIHNSCGPWLTCSTWHLLVAPMQLLLDGDSGEEPQGPLSHTRQRKSILLRVPLGAELFQSKWQLYTAADWVAAAALCRVLVC